MPYFAWKRVQSTSLWTDKDSASLDFIIELHRAHRQDIAMSTGNIGITGDAAAMSEFVDKGN